MIVWGKPYGAGIWWTTTDGEEVAMYRKRNRVRFYTRDGDQVGPEQANVAPALAYAYHVGWAQS